MSSDPVDGHTWLSDEFTSELISSGTIDELARAAKEHGVVITIAFLPDTDEDDTE